MKTDREGEGRGTSSRCEKHRALKILWAIEEGLLVTFLAVMGLALFGQVVFRYVFNAPLIWTEELARYLQIWITFFGVGYGIRNKCHVEVAILYDKLPVKAQKVVTILADVTIIVCSIFYFLPGAIRFVVDQHSVDSSTLPIRMSAVHSVVPLGITIALAYLATDIWFQLRGLVRKGG